VGCAPKGWVLWWTEFPANREKNREVGSFWPNRRFIALGNTNETSWLRIKFPVQSEQGINSAEQGIYSRKSLENREFPAHWRPGHFVREFKQNATDMQPLCNPLIDDGLIEKSPREALALLGVRFAATAESPHAEGTTHVLVS
jgi:hypothetical protein